MAFVLRDHSCGNCLGDNCKSWRRKFSPAERDALMATGLAEETIDGQPVIAAVLLPRRAFIHMSGMARPGWVDYGLPCFRCPWSPAAWPHVLYHGPAWRSDAGERVSFDSTITVAFIERHIALQIRSHLPAISSDRSRIRGYSEEFSRVKGGVYDQ